MPKVNFKIDFFLHQDPDTGGGRSPRPGDKGAESLEAGMAGRRDGRLFSRPRASTLGNRIRTMAYDCPSCPHILMGCLRGRRAAERGGRPREPWHVCPLAEREGNNRRNR